jgi:hypothetical protein
MKVAGQLAIAAALSILPFVLGCQMMRDEATVKIPTAETPQDEALSKSVRGRLLADKKVDFDRRQGGIQRRHSLPERNGELVGCASASDQDRVGCARRAKRREQPFSASLIC